MTSTCDICGRPAVEYGGLRVGLVHGSSARLQAGPNPLSLCYFCVRDTLLQLLKQSEKLSDTAPTTL